MRFPPRQSVASFFKRSNSGRKPRVPTNSLVKIRDAPLRAKVSGDMGVARSFGGRRFAAVALLSVVFSSLANYALARWLGVSRSAPWTRANAVYRRIGPQT